MNGVNLITALEIIPTSKVTSFQQKCRTKRRPSPSLRQYQEQMLLLVKLVQASAKQPFPVVLFGA